MFVRRFLTVWIAASVFLVVVVGGLAALAARQNAYDIQLPQRELKSTTPTLTFTTEKGSACANCLAKTCVLCTASAGN